MPFVASTMSAPVQYVQYGGTDMPVAQRSVTIEGGANVANKNLITPQGVITEVSNEDAAFLNKDQVFNMHRDAGYVQILDKRVDGDAAAVDMTHRDPSAPLVDADFEAVNVPAPKHAGKK